MIFHQGAGIQVKTGSLIPFINSTFKDDSDNS